MSFMESVKAVLGKYATFEGRARRSEFWWWTLAVNGVMAVLYVFTMVGIAASDPAAAGSAVSGGAMVSVGLMLLLALATFLPSLAVSMRRLHDTNRSGFWILITFVPFGGIVLLIFQASDGTPGTNQFGVDPKGRGAAVGGGFGQQFQSYGQQPPTQGSQPRFGSQLPPN